MEEDREINEGLNMYVSQQQSKSGHAKLLISLSG